MNFLRRAWARVVSVGLNRVAWANATKSAGRLELLTAKLHVSLVGSGWMSSGLGKLICHSRSGCLLPAARHSWSLKMLTASLVKVTVQPASQSLPMLSRDVLPKAGKMCASQAVGGRPGRVTLPVCVDAMVVPSGRATWMGLEEGVLDVAGAEVERKWPVEPVSAMAEWVDTGVSGEGPRGGPVLCAVCVLLIVMADVSVLGCPLS